jgi:uncharacterized protein (TIGR02145 family)
MITTPTIRKQKLILPSQGRCSLSNVSIQRGISGIFDCDGNVYTSVIIGTQEWLVENLKTTCYADGTPIPNLTINGDWMSDVTGAYCWYNNSLLYRNIYGGLYNWYAVNNAHGLAITGWRIPTDADWTALTTFLGGETICGGILKETGTVHWWSPNLGATNAVGFVGLPGGDRGVGGGFYSKSAYAKIWTSTEYNVSDAWDRFIYYNSIVVSVTHYPKYHGYSIRLMRDI